MTLGRKNWLFAGSNRGGDACAIAMSLIATANSGPTCRLISA